MTVGELIQELNQYPPNTRIILQKDAEGNGYRLLAGSDKAKYQENTRFQGEVYTEQDVVDYDMDPNELEDVVVLWPV